jgi:hypothetical protein
MIQIHLVSLYGEALKHICWGRSIGTRAGTARDVMWQDRGPELNHAVTDFKYGGDEPKRNRFIPSYLCEKRLNLCLTKSFFYGFRIAF